MKFIKALIVGMMVAVSADANPTFLEPHQTTTIRVYVPAGQSIVSVVASGEKNATQLSCIFDGGNGIPMKKQEHAIMCLCNVPKTENPKSILVQITNEANEKVQYAYTVSPGK